MSVVVHVLVLFADSAQLAVRGCAAGLAVVRDVKPFPALQTPLPVARATLTVLHRTAYRRLLRRQMIHAIAFCALLQVVAADGALVLPAALGRVVFSGEVGVLAALRARPGFHVALGAQADGAAVRRLALSGVEVPGLALVAGSQVGVAPRTVCYGAA